MAEIKDLEVYVFDCPMGQIDSWIRNTLGLDEEPIESDQAWVYSTNVGPVVVRPGMEIAGTTSIWFPQGSPNWQSDIELGWAVSKDLECSVVCDPGYEVHPFAPVFLCIDSDGERLVTLTEESLLIPLAESW